MQTIGFASKFYTLWETSRDVFVDAYGRKGVRFCATFIKNISMNEETARAKYPNAPVDLTLCGHSSWTRTEWEPVPDDVFPCGKYRGEAIADCTDYPYMFWAVDSYMLMDDRRREIAISALIKSGLYAMYDGQIMPMERVNEMMAKDAARDEISARIDMEGSFDIVNVSNIFDDSRYDGFGFLSRTEMANVVLLWNRSDIQMFYYNNCEYYLPIVGGKAKRIKGKKLHIESDSYKIEDGKLFVNVKSISIVK